MQHAEIRQLITTVENDLTKLSESTDGGPSGNNAAALRASWKALVTHLAIGDAPETRQCPSCKGVIMRDATRCTHCWAKSLAPEAA